MDTTKREPYSPEIYEALMPLLPNDNIEVFGGSAYDLAIQQFGGRVICGHVIETFRGSSSIDLSTNFEFVIAYPPSISGRSVNISGSSDSKSPEQDRLDAIEPLAQKAFTLLNDSTKLSESDRELIEFVKNNPR